jgi:hypothetical protein
MPTIKTVDSMGKKYAIPRIEEPGTHFLRDGFTAAYFYNKAEDRLFLLEHGCTMTEIDSRDMREVILAVGEPICLTEALLLLAAQQETFVALA